MKKRRYRWLAGIALAALVVVSVLWFTDEKPVLYEGKPVHQWAMELTFGPEQSHRDAAKVAFRGMGSNATPSLVKQLRAVEPIYQRSLIALVSKLPTPQSQAVFSRLKLVNVDSLHWSAARALAYLGPEARTAIPALAKAIHDPEAHVRSGAAEALASIGPDSIPELIVTLSDPDPNVRWVSARSLGELGTNAQSIAPLLIRTLGDKVPYVRMAAGQSLAAMGPAASPALVQAVLQERGATREMSASLLARISPTTPAATEALISMAADSQPDSRLMAIQTLLQLRPLQTNAIPAVIHALQDKEPQIRLAATRGISDFVWRRRVASATPALIAALQDQDAELRLWSIRALGGIGAPASNAIPALTVLLTDKAPGVRAAATNALERIQAASGGVH